MQPTGELNQRGRVSKKARSMPARLTGGFLLIASTVNQIGAPAATPITLSGSLRRSPAGGEVNGYGETAPAGDQGGRIEPAQPLAQPPNARRVGLDLAAGARVVSVGQQLEHGVCEVNRQSG